MKAYPAHGEGIGGADRDARCQSRVNDPARMGEKCQRTNDRGGDRTHDLRIKSSVGYHRKRGFQRGGDGGGQERALARPSGRRSGRCTGVSISRHGPKPRGRAFVRCDTSRAAQIEAALESPRRVVEIAAIIGHPADRLSANLRDLLRQGRIQRIAWGQYVRAGGRT